MYRRPRGILDDLVRPGPSYQTIFVELIDSTNRLWAMSVATPVRDLVPFQRRREWPTRIIQAIKSLSRNVSPQAWSAPKQALPLGFETLWTCKINLHRSPLIARLAERNQGLASRWRSP